MKFKLEYTVLANQVVRHQHRQKDVCVRLYLWHERLDMAAKLTRCQPVHEEPQRTPTYMNWCEYKVIKSLTRQF